MRTGGRQSLGRYRNVGRGVLAMCDGMETSFSTHPVAGTPPLSHLAATDASL